MWGVNKVINIGFGKLNSGLYNQFPPLLIPFTPLFACRPDFVIQFLNQTTKCRTNNFSRTFLTFSKNFVVGPCGVCKVTNFETVNSILDSILHFPLSLYNFPPFLAYYFKVYKCLLLTRFTLVNLTPLYICFAINQKYLSQEAQIFRLF